MMVKQVLQKVSERLPLRVVLTVPFVIQIVVTTSLIGYLAYQNGQKVVTDLANRLIDKTNEQVDAYLRPYLELPQQLNQLNATTFTATTFNLNDFRKLGWHFWHQANLFKDISYVGYSLPDGRSVGAGRWIPGVGVIRYEQAGAPTWKGSDFATDQQGNITVLLQEYEYKITEDPWFGDTIKAGKPIWTAVTLSDFEAPVLTPAGKALQAKSNTSDLGLETYLFISATYPVYDVKHQLSVIFSIDLRLAEISQFLSKLKISPAGKTFILERDGQLIGSSQADAVLHQGKGKIARYSIWNSSDPVIRALGEGLQKKFGSLRAIQTKTNFTVWQGGQRYFAQVSPWRDRYGLDWLLVVTVPESDFMEQIHANTRTTFLLCVLALLSAIFIGMLTARWVSYPIWQLNQAAKAIAAGELGQAVPSRRQDELGQLSQSFNSMARQLQVSFGELRDLNEALAASQAQLSRYNQTLEQQVQERTQELSQALSQLQAAQEEIIQSEKLAALGQLVAGIAHEINTPLGVIQASIGNITNALEQSLKELPPLIQSLSPEQLIEFFTLLDWARHPKQMLSSREERQLRRSLKQTLTEQGLAAADKLAESLGKMAITESLDPVLPLLRSPNAPYILETAYHLSAVQNNSSNIRLAVDRAARIVYALKNYVRQDVSNIPVLAQISEGIETVLTLYHNQIKQGIEIQKTYDPVPALLCYPEELVQVWSNLISNAIQAMSYKGTLAIALTQEAQQIVVAITDNGPGISPELQTRIFNPFFTTKPSGEGSGLGLSIVRKIIDKHHGGIDVESQPGHTTFRVRLPLVQPESPPTPVPT